MKEMEKNSKRLAGVAGIVCVAAVLTSCMLPPPPDGGRYPDNRMGYPDGGQGYPQEPTQPAAMNIDGCWRFRDVKGRNLVNRIQRLNEDTMLATPVNRGGRSAQYREIGPNLYQDMDGTGTYEFFSDWEAVWRSNDRNKRVYKLTRFGTRC